MNCKTFFAQTNNIPNQELNLPFLGDIQITIKRTDRIHNSVSGNKWYKLKYNLIQAERLGYPILTFGGAYSNHIYAVASACKLLGFKSIGVIRGEKPKELSPTLNYATECGMELKFISREQYRAKHTEEVIRMLQKEFGKFYLVPEGGTNELAIKGAAEILDPQDLSYDYVALPCGTGGTMAGIINSSFEGQVLGFSSLKGGDFLNEEVAKYTSKSNWEIITDYHFGGYAKMNPELATFIQEFEDFTNIPLDPVYTSKMLYGIFDMIEKNKFPAGSRILLIHTGGLQGRGGMPHVFEKKTKSIYRTYSYFK